MESLKDGTQFSHVKSRNPLSLDMGWKSATKRFFLPAGPEVAIRFRWIWDGRDLIINTAGWVVIRRNPLSLDMGWKSCIKENGANVNASSQSAFAGYGMEEPKTQSHV